LKGRGFVGCAVTEAKLTAPLQAAEKPGFQAEGATSAAEAGTGSKLVTASLKRCATQNQERDQVFPQKFCR
jgi:hypothetical protein